MPRVTPLEPSMREVKSAHKASHPSPPLPSPSPIPSPALSSPALSSPLLSSPLLSSPPLPSPSPSLIPSHRLPSPPHSRSFSFCWQTIHRTQERPHAPEQHAPPPPPPLPLCSSPCQKRRAKTPHRPHSPPPLLLPLPLPPSVHRKSAGFKRGAYLRIETEPGLDRAAGDPTATRRGPQAASAGPSEAPPMPYCSNPSALPIIVILQRTPQRPRSPLPCPSSPGTWCCRSLIDVATSTPDTPLTPPPPSCLPPSDAVGGKDDPFRQPQHLPGLPLWCAQPP